MELRFASTDLTEDPSLGVRHQILPLGVKRPDALQTSTKSAVFFEKHHTEIKKSTTALLVPKVAEAMLDDENTTLLSLVLDCIVDAKVKVGGRRKIIQNVRNPDHFTKRAVECPLGLNIELALTMVDDGSYINEVAQPHAIDRVVCV
uniref:Uncharacterized protein n=1 Tax=Peronospora matthiolae TaxID=2874970 RepID=A0AAV1T8D0_9STRA